MPPRSGPQRVIGTTICGGKVELLWRLPQIILRCCPLGTAHRDEDAAHRKISVGRCHILECAIYNARCRRCLWIFDLQPRLRWSRPIYGPELLAHDAFKAELADCFEHFLAVTLGVLDVLNTPARIAKNPFQCILALKKRSAPDVVT